MADSKFDLNKLKESAGGLMGSLKSMMSPAGGTPNVNPDDALGLKIAQLTTLVKQTTDAQQEINKLLNALFQDIEAFRAQMKAAAPAAKPAEAPKAEAPKAEAPKAEAPKEEKKE